jgi:PIN domain nuclease of toxin-antitoxin system
MNVLLDTNAFLWWAMGSRKLPHSVKMLLEDPASQIFVSAASAWEISTKARIGKLPEAAWMTGQFTRIVLMMGFRALPISVEHADLAGSLPGKHRDPFDRVLAAQCRLENLPIATNDGALKSLGVNAVW